MRQLSAHGQFASAPRVTPEYSEPRLEDDEEWQMLCALLDEMNGHENESADQLRPIVKARIEKVERTYK